MNCKRLLSFFLWIIFTVFTSLVEAEVDPGLSRLPSGPSGPGVFGAYYTQLKYSKEWDAPWRIGPDADVVVRFDDGDHRLVFWRGTSYIPCWVTDAGVWYTNEFVERRGAHSSNTDGCVEPMSDKQCRFSHVRVIESNDARVVVHWRYAPVDVRYEHPFIDPLTGWSDWVDEYYTIYPDAIGVRKVTLQTTRPDAWAEFHEAIVVNQPGTKPDDNIELGAVSICNMKGESVTYNWTEDGAPEFDGPKDANILKVNVKGTRRPFALVTPPQSDSRLITAYPGHTQGSHFNWWDHWPVSMVASDGNRATSDARPSHSSLCHIAVKNPESWTDYDRGPTWRTKIMLNGVTDKPVAGLVPLAKSWLKPAPIKVTGDDYVSSGYDQGERAYVLSCKQAGSTLKCSLDASEYSPAENIALVVQGWGKSGAVLQLDGAPVIPGKTFRFGHRQGLKSCDLIVWIEKESTTPVQIVLEPLKN